MGWMDGWADRREREERGEWRRDGAAQAHRRTGAQAQREEEEVVHARTHTLTLAYYVRRHTYGTYMATYPYMDGIRRRQGTVRGQAFGGRQI